MGRPSKPEGERVRDISPTGVRLPPELRDALVRQAAINGRSLAQEITQRLIETFDEKASARAQHKASAMHVAESQASYGPLALSDSQRLLVTLFNTLAPDKQLALLTLLKR